MWHKFTLTKDQREKGEKERITEQFRKLHAASGTLPAAVLLEDKLADQTGAIDIYLSPLAAEIAQPIIDEFSGLPCNSPARPQVTVLYGPKNALDLLDQAA